MDESSTLDTSEGTGLSGSARVSVRDPSRPVCVGLEPRWIHSASDARDALSRNLASPIDWPAAVAALRASGATRLLDLGPGDALGRLSRFVDRDLASIALDGTRDAAAARALLGVDGARAAAGDARVQSTLHSRVLCAEKNTPDPRSGARS